MSSTGSQDVTKRFQEVTTRIRSKPSVAFVGAGFSVPFGMPLWTDLLRRLLVQLKMSGCNQEDVLNCQRAIDHGELRTAADIIRRQLSKLELNRIVKESFIFNMDSLRKEDKAVARNRLRTLALGPWKGVITTNYDQLCEEAYSRYDRPAFCLFNDELGNATYFDDERRFVVKLHGANDGESTVLSTDDYVKTWMSTQRVRFFLISAMLRYQFVFVGCSLEEELVRIRSECWSTFGGVLLPWFALLPANDRNQARAESLERSCGIKTILYPDGEHGYLDRFLDTVSLKQREDFDFGTHPVPALKKMTLSDRISRIGLKNQVLMFVIFRNPNRLMFQSFLNNAISDIPYIEGAVPYLRQISERERSYRLAFLISIGLVKEGRYGQSNVFHVDATVGRAVEESLKNLLASFT
jgi:hypothetical protein